MDKLEECISSVLDDDWDEEIFPADSSGGADAEFDGKEAATEQLRRVVADLIKSSPPHLKEGLHKCHGNSPFFVV